MPLNEQLLDPKRDQLELGLSFHHTKVGEYTVCFSVSLCLSLCDSVTL